MIHQDLSRRERQIMDAVYRLGEATAAEVQDEIPEAPSYSAVRALLRILIDKGHLSRKRDGVRYVYQPVVNAREAKASAVEHLMTTFFDNSVEQVVSTLLDIKGEQLSEDQLKRLSALIEDARNEGR